MATTTGIDPLAALPPELILKVLDFAPAPTLSSLTRVSNAWHHFIDVQHQDAIYSSSHKVDRPRGAKDFTFLKSVTSFSKYFDNVASWKDLCKRQTILARNWAAEQPETTESIIQVGRSRVWRFKPDFKRRFIVSTSHDGGVQVTDMDSGAVIWSVPRTDVRPFAHLEYQDGIAVWDRYGNALEVWKSVDDPDGIRGEFRRIAIINHDCETRGFQLAYHTLCVASSEGHGFVYDMLQTPPVLKTRISLPPGAMGHVYQDEDTILFSMADQGFYFYKKSNGEFLGSFDGIGCTDYRHINQQPSPRTPSLMDAARDDIARSAYPPVSPRTDRLMPLTIESGPLPDADLPPIAEDAWGAGMIDGELFVGLSREGRILIVPKWREELRNNQSTGHGSLPNNLAGSGALEHSVDVNDSSSSGETSDSTTVESRNDLLPGPQSPHRGVVIECEDDNGISFDLGLGGWLAIKDNRFLCEMSGRVYVIALDENGNVYQGTPERASWSMSTASSYEFKSPISFMSIYDDCIMSTYSTLGWDSDPPNTNNLTGGLSSVRRIFPTKTIRTISFPPQELASEEPMHHALEITPMFSSELQLGDGTGPMGIHDGVWID